ncbi:MAG: amidohydrolase, partial [Microcella sp.]|nr:amidohydrolase [Microcella sp.]
AFPGGTPSAADLDSVVGDRPVLLYNRDHHGAWASSAALRLGGVDASTPDPADGRIERVPAGEGEPTTAGSHGSPQGTLHEGAARLVADHAPSPSPDDELAALLEAQRYLHSVGVTAWHDAIVGDYFGASDTALVYRRAIDEGLLTADVVGALWWDRDRGVEQVPELVAKRERHARELGSASPLRLSAVKIMADGVPENGTASMLDPYLGAFGEGDHPRGIPFVGEQALIDAIVALDAAGFSAHVHAIGDRAVRDTLDGFAAARETNGSTTPGRHHIAHVQFVHPDDVARFAALGVTANIQSLWACYEPQLRELTVPIVGAERVGHQYPFASILRARSSASHTTTDARPRLCAGSDWPVLTPDPWAAIHVAVNRTLPEDDLDHDPEPLLPHEALTLAEALDAYTAGSAFINGRGPGDVEVTGVIEVGAVADLAATDRDPFAGPAASIHATRC